MFGPMHSALAVLENYVSHLMIISLIYTIYAYCHPYVVREFVGIVGVS